MALTSGYASSTSNEIAGSRINTDVDRILAMVNRVNDARNKVSRHTSALGYFSDAPQPAPEKVQPISNNLQNAIGDMDRAIDNLHDALRLFE